MIRIFLTIAVVASVTTVAAAGEESDWFSDQPELALESPLGAGRVFRNDVGAESGARGNVCRHCARLLLKRRVPIAEKIIKRAVRRTLT